jgi:hypothetical protein
VTTSGFKRSISILLIHFPVREQLRNQEGRVLVNIASSDCGFYVALVNSQPRTLTTWNALVILGSCIFPPSNGRDEDRRYMNNVTPHSLKSTIAFVIIKSHLKSASLISAHP